MSEHSYLTHRATKIVKPSGLELQLIDRDLAEAGVSIPWTPFVLDDAAAARLIHRIMQAVLRTA